MAHARVFLLCGARTPENNLQADIYNEQKETAAQYHRPREYR